MTPTSIKALSDEELVKFMRSTIERVDRIGEEVRELNQSLNERRNEATVLQELLIEAAKEWSKRG